MPIELRNDGRIMDFNFIASNILKKLGEDHTTPSKHFKSMMKSKYDGHKLLILRYGMQNKRRLERYLGIGKSLTKDCKNCYWHMFIKIRIPECSIIPYPPV